jgi:hypothetical protein
MAYCVPHRGDETPDERIPTMSYHIECRTPETDSGATDTTGRAIRIPAGPWTRDEKAMGPVALYTYGRQEEAEARAASLAIEHSEWEWRAVAD